MRLPREPFDRKAQDVSLADALANAQQTAVYLDTSSLVWMYRLAKGARTEFIDWAKNGSRVGRVHVPVWALHELHKHRRSPDTLFPARPRAKAIETDLKDMKEAAALFVDDALAAAKGFPDRTSYLEFLERSTKDVTRALGLLKDIEVAKVEKQLLPFFESISLSTKLARFSLLQSEFMSRSEGRVPPGYRDASKKGDSGAIGGDGSNRFGDFVLWDEILTHSAQDPSIMKIVIITHDQKDDWVYAPERFVDYDGRTLANNSKPKVVTCPHPTLCHEAETQAGATELYIVTIPQLIQLLSTHGASREVQQLARAVQIEQEAEEERTTDASPGASAADEVAAPVVGDELIPQAAVELPGQDGANEPPDELVAEFATVALLNSLAPEAKADADYQAVGPEGTPDYITRALRTYNWYTQNPAVAKARSAIMSEAASNEQIFVLGRNVYQAACGNARAAIQLVENLETFLSKLPRPQGDLFFAGMLYEAYFNGQGLVRNLPKSDYLEPLFIVAGGQNFGEVTQWFRAQIAANENCFIRLPGDVPQSDVFNVEMVEGHVTAIYLRGMPLTRPADPVTDLHTLSSNMTERKLKQEISEHFATTNGFVSIDPHFEDGFDLSHLSFIAWGTDTEIVFPPRLPAE